MTDKKIKVIQYNTGLLSREHVKTNKSNCPQNKENTIKHTKIIYKKVASAFVFNIANMFIAAISLDFMDAEFRRERFRV